MPKTTDEILIAARRRVLKSVDEDAAQDVIITLWRAIESGKVTPNDAGRYLTNAIHFQRCTRWRARGKEALPASGFDFADTDGEGVESLSDKLDVLATNAGWHALDRSGFDYGALTPEQLRLVNLMDEGYTQVEIAAVFGISPNTVGYRIRRVANLLGK